MRRLIIVPTLAFIALTGWAAYADAAAAPTATTTAQCFGIQEYCVADARSLSQMPPASANGHAAKLPSQDEQYFQALLSACRATYIPPRMFSAAVARQKGSWYYTPCATELGTPSQEYGPLSFIPDTALEAPVLTLALEARSRLVLAAPSMSSSPGPGTGVPKVVNLPTWAWIDKPAWAATSASASAAAVTVTVTAAPIYVSWSWGDGSSTECHGPGTPYAQGELDPAAASPDCGHTYTSTSKAAAGLRFPVTATIYWRVSWRASTGRAGVFPDMTSRAGQAWPVEELDALNVPAN